jgi:ribulose-phosphate 3-epimerase
MPEPLAGFGGERAVRLGAALYNGDHTRLGEEIRRLESVGFDFVHLDVFDGHFVSDIGFAPRTISDLRPLSRLPFEAHIGVDDPLRLAPALAKAGVDLLLIHIESMRMPYEVISLARECGARTGLAVALGTPISQLEPVLGLVSSVLLLSRVTGEGVQGAFDRRVLQRAQAVREMAAAAGLEVDLQVAGGVRPEHIAELVAAGVNTLAVGGGIYRAPDMAAAVAEIRRLAAGQRSDASADRP